MNISEETFVRMLFCGFASLLMACLDFWYHDGSDDDPEKPKYRVQMPGYTLPMYLGSLTILFMVLFGFDRTVRALLGPWFSITVQICLYYPVLMLLLPYLRKYIRARSCSLLWLLPTYLYWLCYSSVSLVAPAVVLRVPGKGIWVLLGIWFAGFVGVMGWKVLEHLRFRRWILKDANPVLDHTRLALWGRVMEETRMLNSNWKLLTSPKLSTPLSIGLFKSSIRVVLPEREYTPEELELILRHELVHIGLQDAWGKFFLVFCTALCWFNPLMWKAMGKSAEDMELCCDETVLLEADDATRRQYARLLLDAAGDGRGFTTCLSASAEAMRYRLKNVVQPRKRYSGAILVGLIFFLLCMTSGYVTLSYPIGNGAELLYHGKDPQGFEVRSISTTNAVFQQEAELTDAAAFHTYLAGLDFYELTGSYSHSESERYSFLMGNGTEISDVSIHDTGVRITMLEKDPKTYYYHLPDGLDWAYLDTLLIPQPAMNVHLTGEGDDYGDQITGYLFCIRTHRDGGRTEEQKGTKESAYNHGIAGNLEFDTAELTFSEELAGPVTVLVERWDFSDSYTVTLTGDEPLPIAAYPAHYTVYASYYDRDGVLREAEFHFNLDDL